MVSRNVGSSIEMVDFAKYTISSKFNKAPFITAIVDHELKNANDFAFVMSTFRDLVGANMIALMISQPGKDVIQQRRCIDFNYTLLISFAHVLGINAIACLYRDRVTADKDLTTFFTTIIGTKYNHAVAFYNANDDSYDKSITRLTKDTLDLNVAQIVVDIVNIACQTLRNVGGFVTYELTMFMMESILSNTNREDWYRNIAISPEQMLGYSRWRNVVDFSLLCAALGESNLKRYTDIYCTSEFWILTDPAVFVYWTWLYSNILMTMQYDHMTSALEGYVFDDSYQSNIEVPSGTGTKNLSTRQTYSTHNTVIQQDAAEGTSSRPLTVVPTDNGPKTGGVLNGGNLDTSTSGGVSLAAGGSATLSRGNQLISDINPDPTPIGPGKIKEEPLWMRKIEVFVKDENDKSIATFNNDSMSPDGFSTMPEQEMKIFAGCDIDFEISGEDAFVANSAIITLWNLSPATKALLVAAKVENNVIKTPGAKIEVLTGYTIDWGLIFTGRISSCYNKWVGGDVATIIIAYDDLEKMSKSDYVNLPYKQGDLYSKALDDICNAGGVKTNYVVDPLGMTFYTKAGESDQILLYGTPAQLMAQMLVRINGDLRSRNGTHGYTHKPENEFIFYIKDGLANICPKGDVSVSEVTMNSETGLMEASFSSNATNDEIASIKSLMQWRIQLGCKIIVDSPTLGSGTEYRVRGFKHTSSGSNYYSETSLGAF